MEEDEDQKDDIKLETKNEIVEEEEEDALAKQRAALEAIKQRAALGTVSLKMPTVTVFDISIKEIDFFNEMFLMSSYFDLNC